MQQVLMPLPLNCPWQAPATHLVQSSRSGHKAPIGAVQLVVSMQSSSSAALPSRPTTSERWATLSVVSRIKRKKMYPSLSANQ